MSPTAGLGANTALRDAALLAKVLVQGMGVDDMGGYERSMREYAGQAVEIGHMGGKHLFGMRAFGELKPATR